jgi:hypothetical protein
MIRGNGRVVVVHVEMAAQIGRMESMLLSQIDYWLERSGHFVDGHFWVYNTLEEWARQLGVSGSAIKRAAQSLEKQGLILRRHLARAPYDRTLSYTICYERLREMGFSAGRRSLSARESADPWDRPLAAVYGDFAEGEDGADKWVM